MPRVIRQSCLGLFMVLVLIIYPQGRAADVDIYMIGNSYTDDSGSLGTVDDMILFAESATRLFGDRFDVNFNVTSTTFGGRKLYEHWQQVSGGSLAGKEHIVLQEQSQFLAVAFDSFPTQLNGGQNFFDLHRSLRGYPGSEAAITNTVVDMVYYGWFRMFNKILNNAPNSTVHIFQTWGRTSGYIGGSYDEHIRRNVIMTEDALEEAISKGLVNPKIGRAGEAWDHIFDTTSLTLHRDGSHGNAMGYYLAAATIFQNILNEEMPGISVADLDYNPHGADGVTLLNAAMLKSGVADGPGTPPFANWIAGYSVGGLSGIDDDADGDGTPNGVEGYFGTDPASPSTGIQAMDVTAGAETTFTFTHPINDNPVSDITASYLWSKDLVAFHADGVSDGSTTVVFSQGAPVNGLVTVTATVSGPSGRIFVAVEVSQD